MSQVKERPVLFSAPMVRAILEGRKTVTRRALNAQALKNIGYGVQLGECHELPSEGPLHPNSIGYYTDFCPFGQPGDRLWVREAWAEINVAQAPGESWVVYRECDNRTDYGGPWKPSIHMRRRDSRILLEITGVRVERLQDISEEQAQAEGIGVQATESFRAAGVERSAGFAFRDLWASTGGDWDANPWVWVVEFKRVTP